MRKIEREMIQAIIERKDWHKANTSVEVHESSDIPTRKTMYIKLHGHIIGQYDDDGTLLINHQGWKTVTTKSRLNALIQFVLGGTSRIGQRNFEWFLFKTTHVADDIFKTTSTPIPNGWLTV